MKKTIALLSAFALTSSAMAAGTLPTPNLGTGTTLNGVPFAPSATTDTTLVANVVGALKKAGDTMTGPLVLSGTTLSLTNPGPTWATPSTTIVDYDRDVINGFPLLSEFGSGTVSVAQGRVAAISIPSTSTLYQTNSLAGYTMTGGSTTAGTAVFGQFSVSGEGAGQANGDALNGVCTNAALQTGTTGFDLKYLACTESDVNIVPLASTAAPTGDVYGFYTAGGSSIQPTGEFSGYYVNVPGTSLKWKSGVKLKDGSAAIGLNLGSLTANTGATSSGSQPIQFNSYSSGVAKPSNIVADPFGNITVNPTVGASTVMTDGSGATRFSVSASGPLLPSYTVATLPGCVTANSGTIVFATDLTAPTYNGALTGGGAVKRPVTCNGTAWVS